MKNLIVLFVLLCAQYSFAQSPNYIEITSVDVVKLSAKSATMLIYIDQVDAQLSRAFDRHDGHEDYEMYNDYSEEEYIYYSMMEENPDKVTKEMKKAHEKREQERKEKREELEKKKVEFLETNVYKASDLQELLDESSVKYSVTKTPNRYRHMHEAINYEPVEISVFEINVNNKADAKVIADLIQGKPVHTGYKDVVYESYEEKRKAVIQGMTANATAEAKELAASFNRKLGKVLSCANETNRDTYFAANQQITQAEREDDGYYNNEFYYPFNTISQSYLKYIYRFELLD